MVDEVSVPRFVETDSWPADVPMLQNGWRPTGGPINVAADQGLLNWPLRELVNRSHFLRQRHLERQMDVSFEMTVGPGGQYATLNAALERLSIMAPRLKPEAVIATVRLLNGFELAEQVIVRGLNMGWVRIISDAATVLIRRASLIVSASTDDGETYYPAIAAVDGGVSPVISCLFVMTAEGAAGNRVGVLAMNGGRVVVTAGAGVQSAGAYGALAMIGGMISAELADFRNAGTDCIRASRGATISARSAILTGAGQTGAYAWRGSIIDCEAATITGAGTNGIFAGRLGRINAYNANCRKGASDASADIFVGAGGQITATGSTGGTTITVNTVTASGIIFK